MMTTIYLTRHGETEWNMLNKLQGWHDSKLTRKGITHAQALGKTLQDVHFDAVFSSPSGRAFSTAQHILCERSHLIQTDERLKEMHLGKWEGQTQEEIKQFDAMQLEYFWNNPVLYTPQIGESYEDLLKRSIHFMNELTSKYPNETILLVTHAITLKSITTHYKKLPLEKFWDSPYIHGTSLTVFQIENEKATFVKEADMSHIDEELSYT
jgi:broad specificity phosphatase PhoE